MKLFLAVDLPKIKWMNQAQFNVRIFDFVKILLLNKLLRKEPNFSSILSILVIAIWKLPIKKLRLLQFLRYYSMLGLIAPYKRFLLVILCFFRVSRGTVNLTSSSFSGLA